MEPGTLYQLRNLIHRRNVRANPKEDVNASEDFVEVIRTGHILSAVMSLLQISSFDEMPPESIVSHDIWMVDDAVRKQVLEGIASSVVNQHVQLSTVFKEGNDSDKPHVKRKQRKEKSDEKEKTRWEGKRIADFSL